MTIIKHTIATIFTCLTILGSSSALIASEIEGFIIPYRDIDVASQDTGTIAEISVKEGENVSPGQLLASLDYQVLEASSKIADQSRNARGKLESAQAQYRLNTERLEKLRMLLNRKHASQEEVDRTIIDKEVAAAQLLAVEEELNIRSLEYDRIQKQIEQRRLRSPIEGVVAKVYKDIGEFVAPTDPVVVKVVQLDPLIGVFSVPNGLVNSFSKDLPLTIFVGSQRTEISANVESISSVIDAKSATVEVKVRIPNPDRSIRSGDKCVLNIGGTTSEQAALDQKPSQQVNFFDDVTKGRK